MESMHVYYQIAPEPPAKKNIVSFRSRFHLPSIPASFSPTTITSMTSGISSIPVPCPSSSSFAPPCNITLEQPSSASFSSVPTCTTSSTLEQPSSTPTCTSSSTLEQPSYVSFSYVPTCGTTSAPVSSICTNYAEYSLKQRRQRLFQLAHKAKRRLIALEKHDLSAFKKVKITEASKPVYMSSDEECQEGFITHQPSWQSSKFKEYKAKLNGTYLDRCSTKSRRPLQSRVVGDMNNKETPDVGDNLKWIIKTINTYVQEIFEDLLFRKKRLMSFSEVIGKRRSDDKVRPPPLYHSKTHLPKTNIVDSHTSINTH
ncbi:Hypothetical predicted protein [Mytilus galloprovincialis]|uniref:Uncharacterized protein n=1 Tax=Mytilus galloprovincialis TaxID=29158 RepID=A0A8B6C909_MYTGA|nr:Hypothetical predicted protein [Mytilus galloprovincialis]